jgi:hypothetical protein
MSRLPAYICVCFLALSAMVVTPIHPAGAETSATVGTCQAGDITRSSPQRGNALATGSSPYPVKVISKPSKRNAFKSVKPTVTGVLRVGSTLRVASGTWTPTPPKFYYQWRRNGSKIKGANSASYVLMPAELQKYVTVQVWAKRGGEATTRESTTATRVGDGEFVPATATISGDRVVGDVLTASSTVWTPAPEVLTYQWTRNQQPISDATSSTYTPQAADVAKDLAVTVIAHRKAFTPASVSSPAVRVSQPELSTPQTFADVMKPESTTVLAASTATVTFSDEKPDWFPRNTFIRWDTPGAFAHTLDPVPYGTLNKAAHGGDIRPEVGAEYHLNNSFYKYADVSFTVTGQRFAIRYWTYGQSDAMVWIDGRPAASSPIAGSDPGGTGRWNWLIVSRSSGVPATVRMAGPMFFSGVDFDACDSVTVAAAPQFTLGVISDSMFETMPYDSRPATNGPGQTLSTLTGFRVWNMAEGGTGYVNDGTGVAASGGIGYPGHLSSPYGSARRIATIAAAPIDALLVNGSLNDRSWSANTQRDALHAFLDDVAEVRPDLPIVLVTLEPLSFFGARDQDYPQYRALNANFAPEAAEHPNVVGVIDPYTADWITGTGSTAQPAGDGNADQYVGSDGIHLNGAGQAYYQGRIAEELRPMLLSAPQDRSADVRNIGVPR